MSSSFVGMFKGRGNEEVIGNQKVDEISLKFEQNTYIVWQFKFANLCRGYHASLSSTTWNWKTKMSRASSPHRLLTPSSCSQLNSGQTSRLVSCGVTFGSQYTHLIRPSSFFQRTPSARFSPSLLILALLDMSRFLWLLMMVPLSGFLIGLEIYIILRLWFCMSSAN